MCNLGWLHPTALGSDVVVLLVRQPHGEVSSGLLTYCCHFQIVSDGGREQGQGHSSKSFAENRG